MNGTLTAQEILELFNKQGGRCAVSGVPLQGGRCAVSGLPLAALTTADIDEGATVADGDFVAALASGGITYSPANNNININNNTAAPAAAIAAAISTAIATAATAATRSAGATRMWTCLKGGHTWEATDASIVSGCGCGCCPMSPRH